MPDAAAPQPDRPPLSFREPETRLMDRCPVPPPARTASAWAPVDLVPLVKEMLPRVRSSCPRALTIRTRFGDACPVWGRRPALRRMGALLVARAVTRMAGTWTERPTVLDVSARPLTADADLAEACPGLEAGRYAHLAVSSSGGRPRACAPREPEGSPPVPTNADAPPTGDADSTASSLQRARRIVEGHRGTIAVRTAPDRGTTVHVYLPLAAEPSPPPPSVPAPEAASPRALVVDDDKTVRALEGARLGRLGCAVTRAATAEQALAAVRRAGASVDLALVDYHLPTLNGLELAHALRGRGCRATIALMTGFSAQVSEATVRVVGIDHLLRKPVERRTLAEVLTSLHRSEGCGASA